MTIFALHGFLGRPSDFDGLKMSLKAIDYLKIHELSSDHDFETWAENWNQFVQEQTLSGAKRVLVGYSQGGRLALQAVRQNPGLWSGLVLISANPGISSDERSSRLKRDQEWARDFEEKDFATMLEQWNAQPVFKGGSAEPLRRQSDYDRRLLAQCLSRWSVGRQDDFYSFLKTTTMPVAYVSGAKDSKYVAVGQELKKINPQIQNFVVENAGHRVLFDQPQILSSLIQQFISTLQ